MDVLLAWIIGNCKSKTFWAGLITAALPLLNKSVDAWIATHPGVYATLAAGLMVLLRQFTVESIPDKTTTPPAT